MGSLLTVFDGRAYPTRRPAGGPGVFPDMRKRGNVDRRLPVWALSPRSAHRLGERFRSLIGATRWFLGSANLVGTDTDGAQRCLALGAVHPSPEAWRPFVVNRPRRPPVPRP